MNYGFNGVKLNSELREDARKQLQNNWIVAILTCVIFEILVSVVTFIPLVGWILVGPITLGLNTYFLNLKRGKEAYIENIFDGFKVFSSSSIAQILIVIITFALALLFIIPGIIAYFCYSQTLFILADYPEMTALDAMKTSNEMMRGYKGKLFMLNLSFIGWGLLCVLTFGIGFLWLTPYIYASLANFYDNVKNNPIG